MNNGLKFACLSLIHAIILQCRSGSGVCPDTMVAGGNGTNDVSNVTGRVTNGLTCVKYLRMLNTDVCVCNIAISCVVLLQYYLLEQHAF